MGDGGLGGWWMVEWVMEGWMVEWVMDSWMGVGWMGG